MWLHILQIAPLWSWIQQIIEIESLKLLIDNQLGKSIFFFFFFDQQIIAALDVILNPLFVVRWGQGMLVVLSVMPVPLVLESIV